MTAWLQAQLGEPELVGWLFLVVAGWGAVFTVNAHRPFRGPLALGGRPVHWLGSGVGIVVSFFPAWLTTELALHHLVAHALVASVLVGLGALETWPGWVGAGLTLLSWIGLWSLHRASMRDGHVVAQALREGLDDPTMDPPVADVDWWRVLWPFGVGHGIVRHRDIAYVDDGSSRHRLDLHHRRDLAPGAPVLLQIHGGGWVVGDKGQQGLPLVRHMARRGWLCVSINYALSPRATWPDHLVDCKRALAWIRAHAAEYGGDPRRVVVTGGSAGGHLTAMMGLTANDPAFQPGFEEVDTSVSAFVPFYGVFDWTDRFGIRGAGDGLVHVLEKIVVKRSRDEAPDVYEAASPIAHIDEAAPPAMVIHGSLDNLAPIDEARRFVRALRDTSRNPVVYVELDGAHHAFDVFESVRTLHAIHGVEAFARRVVDAADDERSATAKQVG